MMAKEMIKRKGTYYYIFPTYNQGKKILWDGMDRDGFKFTDHIPKELIVNKNDSEMKIKTKNGSIMQIVGSDNIDSVVGTNPFGCIFSEYSLQDPRAWDYMRPILAENGGWAVFNFTPRGKNHAHQLYEAALHDPDWFCEKLTVEDTKAIAPEVLSKERAEIIAKNGDDALYWQEYFCSFDVPVQGAYFAKQIDEAEKNGRILDLQHEPVLPVSTFWDLGIGDSMAIWFVQSIYNEVRVIDYLEAHGEGMAYYAQELQKKGYTYSGHYMPHDAEVREIGTGKSRKEVAEALGLRPITVLPALPVDDGIQAARLLFPKCIFDKTKCKRGLEALREYHKEWDDINKVFKNRPHHNWASHGADAFRYLAMGFKSNAELRGTTERDAQQVGRARQERQYRE